MSGAGVRRASLTVFVLAAAALLLGFPLLSFLAVGFWPGLFGGAGHASFTLAVLAQALRGHAARALLASCALSVTSGVLATAAGAWLAWLRERTRLAGSRFIEGGVWVLLLVPSYALATSWMLALSPGGPLGNVHAVAAVAAVFFGPVGIALVLAIKAVPLAYLAVGSSISRVSASLDEAGRTHGLSPLRRAHLQTAVLAPALAAGFTIAFAESLSDFGVAATLGAGSRFPLATYAIYSALDAEPLNFPLASASSLLLLVVASLAVWIQSRVTRASARFQTLKGGMRARAPHRLSRVARFLHGAGLTLFALVALGVPAGGAIAVSFAGGGLGEPRRFTLRHYAELFRHHALTGAFLYSAELAVCVAAITLVLALGAAWILTRRSAAARALDAALVAVMALPAIVLAGGYLFAYNQAFLPLAGTTLLLSMAYVTLALPLSSRTLVGPVAQLHAGLGEAACVHGLSGIPLWRSVYLPLLAAPLLYAWLLTTAHVIFELPASQILYPPGHPTLAVALTGYLNRFHYGAEAALQIVSMAVVAAALLAIRALYLRLAPPAWRPMWGA